MIGICNMVPYRKWFQCPKTSMNRYPVRCSSDGDPVRGQSDIKGGQLFSQTEGGGREERVGLKRKIEMTCWIFRSVTLCNRWVAGIHLPREKERQNTPHGHQWDFSNYLLLHIWMRWAMRGLEACPALSPSENHLQSDFKIIPIMLQDKSLITGNYGLPISRPPPSSSFLWPSPFGKSPLPHPHYFYSLIQQEKQPERGKQSRRGGREGGYYLGADTDHGRWRFTALPFMWSGSLVGSNYRPNDPNWA